MKVALSLIEPAEHAERLFVWRTRPDIAGCMYGPAPVNREAHGRWLAALPGDATRRHWVILHGGEPVGSAYLTEIDRRHARASFGMYVADEGARVLGVGAAAEWLALEAAFAQEGLEKVSCEVFARNEAPRRMHLRMGFKPEGVLRRHAWCDGGWTDVHRLSLLREEWREARAGLRRALRKLLDEPAARAAAPALLS